MKDRELYDFFKERKQVFDEAPGNALWAKIETGLADNSAPGIPFKFPFFRLLMYSMAGVTVIAMVWFALSRQDYEKPVPKTEVLTISDEKGPAIVNEATVGGAGLGDQAHPADSVKKRKLPVMQKEFVPITEKITDVAQADSIKFDVTAVQSDVKKVPGRVNVSVKQALTKSQFDLFVSKMIIDNANSGDLISIKAPGHKTFRQLITSDDLLIIREKDTVLEPGKLKIDLINKKPLMPRSESILVESVHYEKERSKTSEERGAKRGSSKKNGYGDVIIVVQDSIVFDPAKVKKEVLKAPGRITIKVKQQLTKQQFENFKNEIIDKSDYPSGTVIIINAPGHQPYEYEMSGTAEF